MRARNRSNGPDLFLLSYLDVLSCGLGGTIILFLAFSVVASEPAGTGFSRDYIRIEWYFDRPDAALRIHVEPPADAPFDVCPSTHPRRCTYLLTSLQTTVIPGVGRIRLVSTSPQDPASTERAALILYVLNPASGPWRFTVRLDDAVPRGGLPAPSEFTTNLVRGTWRTVRGPQDFGPETLELQSSLARLCLDIQQVDGEPDDQNLPANACNAG